MKDKEREKKRGTDELVRLGLDIHVYSVYIYFLPEIILLL